MGEIYNSVTLEIDMFKKIKTLATISALTVAMPFAASAATITGLIGIEGDLVLGGSEFTATGNVDFDGDGETSTATGSFSGIAANTAVTLNDFDFTDVLPTIWAVGDFIFVASHFFDFDNVGSIKGFVANGIISDTVGDLEDTYGQLIFSANESSSKATFSSVTAVPVPAAGLLLIAGLGALGVAGRRKKAA